MTSDNYGKRFSPTWCILPWVHAATLTDGSTQLCCVAEKVSEHNLNNETISKYWNSSYIATVRKNMLAGKTVDACRRCYEEEKNGYRSHRLIENKAWHDKIGFEDINSIVEDSKKANANIKLQSIDLRLGNTCNLECIMCQPRESSKWVSSSEKILSHLSSPKLIDEWKYKKNIKVGSYEWYKNENLWTDLKDLLPHIKEIIVAGGEPMLIKQHLKFIRECSETEYAKNIHIRYHTNLMELPVDMITVWEKFKNVEFFASIDGMEHVAKYIRYPSDWDKIKKNIQVIDEMKENVWLRFLFSVQALNIEHLPDFIRWVREQNFKKARLFQSSQAFIHPGLVHWPEYLNPKILSKEDKARITEKFITLKYELQEPFDKFDGIVSFMNSEDWSAKRPILKEYLNALDKMRGTNAKGVFPQLSL